MSNSDSGIQYSWAVVQPSPSHSVRYLGSPLATSAAKRLPCGRYLAVIVDPKPGSDGFAAGNLVQSASHRPLPDTYLPISPCKMGSREPLVPDFDWPFGECIINTGKFFLFHVVRVRGQNTSQFSLSKEAALHFSSVRRKDWHEEQWAAVHRRRAAQKADGAPDDVSQWTSFSVKSTAVPAMPGEFFSPIGVHALVTYDILSLKDILLSSQCFEDARAINRIRARFSRPATERTIVWNMNQAACASVFPPVEDGVPEFHPALIEFSANIERPHSPDRVEEVPQPTSTSAEDAPDDDDWGVGYFYPEQSTSRPPPPFDSPALQIIYLDVYGTLIDSESGIFDALQPLLSRSLRRLERREALTLYFESEIDAKQRLPSATYPQILTHAHEDMAARLGLAAAPAEAASFASSLASWALIDGAAWCLNTLRHYIPFLKLVALCDVPHETLRDASAFATLAPYFAEVFTWDAARAYRPDANAFNPVLQYHDAMGIPREQRCFLSNSLLRDLEPAVELGIPTVWMRFPASLAGGSPSAEGSTSWAVCADFPDLVFRILQAKGAIPR
ncbi:HAD-like domain-containing protein, partial [Mycena latifolia]